MSSEAAGAVHAPRLINSKFRLPLPPPAFLSRERLLAALRAGIERRVVVVMAPAGFGKTTLIAELARDLGSEAAWLTLDSGDQDFSVFVHYLAAAVAQVRPGFGAELRAWLAATPTPVSQVEDCATILLSELEEIGDSPLVLFLDDFHEVGNSDSILRLLDMVVRYLPPHIHLVMTTRTAPTLPTTRLLVQQQISALGAAELRFTTDEAGTWLALRPGPHDPAEVQRLIEVSEGWVTGMILQSTAALPPLAGVSSDQLYAYLSAEVLERQPPALQTFLQRAAVLPHLTAPLCRAVLDVEDAGDMLRRIHEQQLFLTALGGRDAPYYRLHQLFREFLLRRLQELDPEEFLRLQQRAAGVFEQQGEYGLAMEHWASCAAWHQAAELAERVGDVEIEAGRVERVAGWLARFPPEERTRRPGLLLLEARLLIAQAEYTTATDILRRADRLVQAAGDRVRQARVLNLQVRLAAAHRDGRHMVALAEQVLQIAEADPATRAHAYHSAAIGYADTGDTRRADQAFAAALDAYVAQGDLRGSASVMADWGCALVLREDLGQAAEQLEKALDYANQTNDNRLQAVVLSNLTDLHQSRGEWRQAEETAVAALAIARRLRWWRVELEILLSRAEHALEVSGPRSALPLYEEIIELAHRSQAPAWISAVSGQARCLRRAGRYADALRVARAGLDAAQAGAMGYEAAVCRLELGAASLAQAPSEALPLLREAEQTLTALGRRREAARAAVLLATALFAGADYSGAEAMLGQAALVAAQSGSSAYLAPELATVCGLPLLRRASRTDSRYAEWLDVVSRHLEAEHLAADAPLPEGDGPLQLVRGRPRLLEVYSLGQASVYRDGVLLAREWQTATAKELFFYFVEHPEGRRKEVILAALWPDQSYNKANDNFHTSLRRLRSALGMDMIKVEDNVYRLSQTLALWHDGTEALGVIERARQAATTEEARRGWTAAADLLQGPFAEEFYRDWAGARRQFWETQTREVFSWLADDALRSGAHDAATLWSQRLIALDPFDEAAHALLMRIHASAGNTTLLVQQYTELARLLQSELGAKPSKETQTLYQRLLSLHTPHDQASSS